MGLFSFCVCLCSSLHTARILASFDFLHHPKMNFSYTHNDGWNVLKIPLRILGIFVIFLCRTSPPFRFHFTSFKPTPIEIKLSFRQRIVNLNSCDENEAKQIKFILCRFANNTFPRKWVSFGKFYNGVVVVDFFFFGRNNGQLPFAENRICRKYVHN